MLLANLNVDDCNKKISLLLKINKWCAAAPSSPSVASPWIDCGPGAGLRRARCAPPWPATPSV